MKDFRKRLCEDCLELLREYERGKKQKSRKLKINEVGAQISGKILINKKINYEI